MRTDEAPTEGIGTMADAPRVFLSYSHDSDEHADRVFALADTLRDRGINVILDDYVPRAGEGLAPLDGPESRRGRLRADGLHRDLPPPCHGTGGAR